MEIKCPKIPKKVRDGFKKGMSEVNTCDPNYEQSIKVIKRKGEVVCGKYRKKDIPEECWNEN